MESTRRKIIDHLEKHANEYISGQQLSEALNISRSAVWKHMKELEKDGYEIEAVTRKGYRIKKFPDKVSDNTLLWGLHTNWLGQKLVHHQQVTSTQTIAHQLALNGAEHGTVVIADEQTQGRGRLNRTWHSARGEGIWMSIILRPKIQPQQAPQLTLLTATVLAKVFERDCGINPYIKWPNDILIQDRKVAGILTEMQAEQDQIQYIVLGMGINVNQTITKMPEELHKIATSLKQEANEAFEIKQLIQSILQAFEESYEEYLEVGFSTVKTKWESYGYRIGEKVKIKTYQKLWEATLVGIKQDGALIAHDNDGEEHILYSAEIQWEKG